MKNQFNEDFWQVLGVLAISIFVLLFSVNWDVAYAQITGDTSVIDPVDEVVVDKPTQDDINLSNSPLPAHAQAVDQLKIGIQTKQIEKVSYDQTLPDNSLDQLKQGRQNSLDFLYAISH